VASRSPEQLTQLFEQISGSDALAKPYEVGRLVCLLWTSSTTAPVSACCSYVAWRCAPCPASAHTPLLAHKPCCTACADTWPPTQEAAAAKAKAEERAALLFAKRKATVTERKDKKEQKDEAERYLAAKEALVRAARGRGGEGGGRGGVCVVWCSCASMLCPVCVLRPGVCMRSRCLLARHASNTHAHTPPQAQRHIYYFLWQLYHLQQDEATALQQQQELADQLAELNQRNERCVACARARVCVCVLAVCVRVCVCVYVVRVAC
jgi:hypothetical protein